MTMTTPLLWISDVLKLDFEAASDHYKTVRVMGTIVSVRSVSRDTKIIYDVDDGTGNIKVVQFVSNSDDVPKEQYATSDQMQTGLARKMQDFVGANLWPQIGQTVDVKGRPQMFNGMTEILCYTRRHVLDLNAEVERMLMVHKICQSNVYSSEI